MSIDTPTDDSRVQSDFIGVLEAAYRIRQSAEEWVKGILNTARPIVDDGFGVGIFTHDAAALTPFSQATFAPEEMSDAISSWMARSIAAPGARPFESSGYVSCFTASEAPRWFRRDLDRDGRDAGIRDALAVSAVNPDRRGCALIAPLRSKTTLSHRRRDALTKMASHIAAGYRLRAALKDDRTVFGECEALFGNDGTVLHATGEAGSDEGLANLRICVASLAKARGPLRSSKPESALAAWPCLASGRWSLVDVRQPDGQDRLAALPNRPATLGPEGVSRREREIVAFAAMGHDSKMIAYNLGLPSRLVDILSARAARKLGLRSRRQLVDYRSQRRPRGE
jgi:DNA-binding CsgD family transcriptional regulator